MWVRHTRMVYTCCDGKFWDTYKSVRAATVQIQDKVLSTVKDLLPKSPNSGSWPRCNRTLRQKINRKAGEFWSNVQYTHTIDLSQFNLPGVTGVKFTFVDPIFMWVLRCNALVEQGIPVYWDAKKLHHPDKDEEIHGAGIQYSLLLRSAAKTVPTGGKVALFNISWDGGNTGFGSRSAVPIVVQVMNTNSMSVSAVALLGYLPSIEVAKGFQQESSYKMARNHLLQSCIGSILQIIEAQSRHGFTCRIRGKKMFLFPRLGAMSLDTPERVKYFGLRNVSACGICRRFVHA